MPKPARSKLSLLRGQDLIDQRKKERRKGMDAFAAISRYLYDPNYIDITEEEEAILHRFKCIWHDMCLGNTTVVVISNHVAKFGMHERTALHDMRYAKELFGDPRDINKKADAAIAADMAKNLYQKAIAAEDFGAASKALANFIKARGLDRDDPEMPDFSKLEIHPDEISIPEDQARILSEIVKSSPVFNVSDLFQNLASDVEYSEEE